jgi:hypothetical protein
MPNSPEVRLIESRRDSDDERRLLAQRIAASPPFQRAERLRSLLLYLVEETIQGRTATLTEQTIGHVLFGKPSGYSPTEDSSVRANARLLRMRLHEYYDGPGRADSLILDLPKGSYAPVFRPSVVSNQAPAPARFGLLRGAAMVGAACLLCAIAGFLIARWQAETAPPPSWPLSEVYDPRFRTQVVISDINLGLFRLLSGRNIDLPEYLSSRYPASAIPADSSARESQMARYLAVTQFVSSADSAFAVRLAGAFGGADRIRLRSARELKTHDLSEGNFIFVGSPASNPFVSLFYDRLNFVEVTVPGIPGSIVNRHPSQGERDRYSASTDTGGSGDEYAALALLPSVIGRGNVLILQGLHQEGTEAAGLLIATAEGRAKLRSALKIRSDKDAHRLFFEVLIRSRIVGGSSAEAEIVASRILH